MKVTVRKKPILQLGEQASEDGTIETPEGTLSYKAGDWILTDVRGGRSPVAREVFEATYEIVHGRRGRPLEFRFTESEVDAALLVAGGRIAAAARALGCDRKALRFHLRKRGISAAPTRRVTIAEVEAALERHRDVQPETARLTAAALDLGCCKTTVRNVLVRAGKAVGTVPARDDNGTEATT